MLGPKGSGCRPVSRNTLPFNRCGTRRRGRWTVRGDLTLHGQTRPVKLDVRAQNGHFKGAAPLKQRDFGIEPVSVGGGAVKVKNELRVEFDIVAKP